MRSLGLGSVGYSVCRRFGKDADWQWPKTSHVCDMHPVQLWKRIARLSRSVGALCGVYCRKDTPLRVIPSKLLRGESTNRGYITWGHVVRSGSSALPS